MKKELELTQKQKYDFERIWFIYGNSGPKSTTMNHKLVQGFYQYNENRIEAYKQGMINLVERFGEDYAKKNGMTDECVAECEKILNDKSL